MAQYTEGQRLKGSDGNIYVVRGGVPVLAPQAMTPTNPLTALKTRQQMIDVQKGQSELQKSPYELRKEAADAAKAELDLKNAQEAYNTQHPKGSTATVLGPDSLKALSPPDQEIVKALADGRLAFPAGFALKAPWWQQKLEQVAAYDPSFDATNFNNRAKARAMLLTGKVGTSANALNTSIGHLGLLNDQVSGTASHAFTPANAVINKFEQLTGDPGITNFKDTAGKLASELTSVYRNGGGAEQDVIRQLQSLDPNASEQQKRAVIKNALDLLASKQAANLYQYSIGSGGKPEVDLLDPAARKVLDQFPDIRDKYFAQPSGPISKSAAALLQAHGATPPPPPAGFSPPPTGPTGGTPKPSTDGFDSTPDPKSAAFWNGAIKQGVPYRQALDQWKQTLGPDSVVQAPDPNLYAKAVTFAKQHPNIPYSPAESILRKPVGPGDQVLTDAAFSGPAVGAGHFANQLAASVPTALAGDQGARYLAVSDAMHPRYAMAGDIGGATAGMFGTAKAVNAGVDALKANPLLARYFTATGMLPKAGLVGVDADQAAASAAARRALTGETVYGMGSGAAQNPDNPALGAAEGAGATLAGNAAGRYVFGPAIRGAAKGFNKAASAFGAAPLDIPQGLSPGQNMIFNRANPAADAIQTNLQDAANLNLPYSLADSDPRLRLLAGSAARKSPNVRALAESVFGPRQQGQAERAIEQVNANLAPVGDVPTLQANILKTAQTQSKPLYDAAKSQPVPELTANPQLKEILDRPAAQSAIRKGYETALNNGEDVGTLTYATDPNGNPVQYGNPSWNVIHYARRALDDAGETSVRQALDKQIATLNPGFKVADAAYSTAMKGSDALQAGANATGIKVTPEATQRALGGFPNNVPQFQQGYASSLADQVEQGRLSGNPYNLIYGSLGQRAKVNSVFPQGAANFARAGDLEGDMSKTGTELFGGSQTQPRAEADKLFDNPGANLAGDIAFGLATGTPPPSLIKRGLGAFARDNLRLGINGAAKADQIAPILLNTDPNAALKVLGTLRQQALLRQIYVNQTGALGGAVGAPILFGSTLAQ